MKKLCILIYNNNYLLNLGRIVNIHGYKIIFTILIISIKWCDINFKLIIIKINM